MIRALAGFLSGVVVYRLHRDGKLNRLPSVRPELIYALFFLACAMPAFAPTPTFDLAIWMLLPFAVAFLVKSDKPLARIYVWLGSISYPLYVSQLAAIRLVLPFIVPQSAKHSILFAIPMAATAIFFAWIISLATNLKAKVSDAASASQAM
jgi:peptidoglycan/LPS O-acetylase OafA/YrhL